MFDKCACFYNLLLLLALIRACIGSREISSPALEFSKHKIVQPIVHHGRTKREISTTRDTDGAHHPEVHVTIPIDGEPCLLELRLNEDLVTEGHTLQYQEGGKTVQHRPKKEEIDLCHYSGSVRGKPQSWVAVSTCRGVRGVIFDGQRMRYIEPAQGAEIQSTHYLYDHKDLIPGRSQSPSDLHGRQRTGDITNDKAHDRLLTNHRTQRETRRSIANRYKREVDTQVREPYTANKSSRYVELVLAADRSEFDACGRDVGAVHAKLIQLANIINSMYAPLNIYIALVGVEVWSERDHISITESALDTLMSFLDYREKKLVVAMPNDNAHLITHHKFGKKGYEHVQVLGISLPSAMCSPKTSGGVSTDHSEVIGLVAATIAHEMGHNFGMKHDDSSTRCHDKRCIMTASGSSVVPVHWSTPSVKTLEESFEDGLDYCLHNKPKWLFGSPTCGNGFVEPGEECDCGITAGGGSNPCHACCHPDTCRLRANATCGAGACCDFSTCRPRSAGAVCRAAERDCDLPEYCTGHSEYCPADVYKMDSTPCGVGGDEAYCVQGECSSHTDHCRLLWGKIDGSRSHEECYVKNTEGTKEGNCGYDSSRNTYKACASGDALCGMLQCHSPDYKIHHAIAGYLGAHPRLSSYVRNNERFDCYYLEDAPANFGLVPDGAKCGDGRMCLKQRCVSVESVREEVSRRDASVCPSNCSGHGVCNSEGHCHCDAGFAPPQCAGQGPGGSVDSGPATESRDRPYNSRPTFNPTGSSANSRPTNEPSDRSYNSRPTFNPSGSPANSRPTNEQSDRSSNSRPMPNPSGSSANSRPTNEPSNRPYNSRPTFNPSGSSANSRPTNEPSDRSYNSRPTFNPSGSSANSRPTNEPSDRSYNSRPTFNPNGSSANSRPTNEPSGRSYNSRPTLNPSGGSANSRPTNEASDRSYNSRPTFIPSGSSANSRSTNVPSNRSYNSRPKFNPSGSSANSRPSNEPSDRSYNSRPTFNPSDSSANARPTNEPSDRSYNSRPTFNPSDSSANSRPTNEPSDRSHNSRQTYNPSGNFANSRPTIKPVDRSYHSRPNYNPNDRSYNFRPIFNPSGNSANPRPTIKPSDRSYNSRPTLYPSGSSANSRPTKKPSDRSYNSRPTYAPSGRSANAIPNIDTRFGSVDSESTNENNGQRSFMIAMYVIFLGIVPSIILLLILIYYWKRDMLCGQPKELYANFIACWQNNSKYAKTKEQFSKTKSYSNLDNVKETEKSNTEKPTLHEFKQSTLITNITQGDIKLVTGDNQLKHIQPVDTTNNNLKMAINSVKLKSLLTGTNDNKTLANDVKLKSINAVSKSHRCENILTTDNNTVNPVKTVISTNKNSLQLAINEVKLKPVLIGSNSFKAVIANDVKLKHARPSLINKPKPLITSKPLIKPKPEWLKTNT